MSNVPILDLMCIKLFAPCKERSPRDYRWY